VLLKYEADIDAADPRLAELLAASRRESVPIR
jgi:hypothetical protein